MLAYQVRVVGKSMEDLENQKQEILSKIAPGFSLLSEEIISDENQVKTAVVVGNTLEGIYNKIKYEYIEGDDVREILNEKEINSETILIDAWGEDSAREIARQEASKLFGKYRHSEDIKLIIQGSRGFFGFGKKPNQYEAVLRNSGKALKIVYRAKPAIVLAIGVEELPYGCPECGHPVRSKTCPRKHGFGEVSFSVNESGTISWQQSRGAGVSGSIERCRKCDAPLAFYIRTNSPLSADWTTSEEFCRKCKYSHLQQS